LLDGSERFPATPQTTRCLSSSFWAQSRFITTKGTVQTLKIAFTTAQPAIDRLERVKIIKQVGEAERGRIYCGNALLKIPEEPAHLNAQ
jgi:hypothetical protein